MNFKEELTKYIDIINNELTKYLKKEGKSRKNT